MLRGKNHSRFKKTAQNRNKAVLLIEPASSCNLGCKYCYANKASTSSNQVMDYKTLENLTKKALNHFNYVQFLWHGGEPLNQDISFYKKAIELQEKYENPQNEIENCMQTNGTLITEEYANFFEKNNITPGISIDGPKEIHNKTRIYKNGKGTFEDVMKGVKTLKEKDIHPGAIMVATQYSKGNAERIYNFFKENKINLKINPFYSAGDGKGKEDELLLSPEEMGEIWINFFDIWFNDDDCEIEIEPFKQTIEGLLTGVMSGCSFRKNSCSHYFFINPKGYVSVCGEWSKDAGLGMGNINENSFNNFITSQQHFRIERRGKLPEYHPDCKECKWKILCEGGCSHKTYEMKGTIFEKDPFCEARKMLFNHIYEEVQKNAETEVNRCISR